MKFVESLRGKWMKCTPFRVVNRGFKHVIFHILYRRTLQVWTSSRPQARLKVLKTVILMARQFMFGKNFTIKTGDDYGETSLIKLIEKSDLGNGLKENELVDTLLV